MSLVPTSKPDVTDACGCTPRAPLAGGKSTETDPQPAATLSSAAVVESEEHAEAPRRSLKLVVTLTPAEGGQYRAALALGAEDCDPVLRSTTVSALPGALEHVPALLEEAEEHWRLHPRNPTTARTPARGPGADRSRSEASAPRPRKDQRASESLPDGRADDDPPAPPATEPVMTPKRPTGGQLTLFG